MDLNLSYNISNEDLAAVLRSLLLFLENINFKATSAALKNESSSKGFPKIAGSSSKIVIVRPITSLYKPGGQSHKITQTEIPVSNEKSLVLESSVHVFQNVADKSTSNINNNLETIYNTDVQNLSAKQSSLYDVCDKECIEPICLDKLESGCNPEARPCASCKESKEVQNASPSKKNARKLENRRSPNSIESELPTKLSSKKSSQQSNVKESKDKSLRKTSSNPSLKLSSAKSVNTKDSNKCSESEASRAESENKELKKKFRQLQDEHQKLMGVASELTSALQTHILGQSDHLNSMLNTCKTIYPDLFKKQQVIESRIASVHSNENDTTKHYETDSIELNSSPLDLFEYEIVLEPSVGDSSIVPDQFVDLIINKAVRKVSNKSEFLEFQNHEPDSASRSKSQNTNNENSNTENSTKCSKQSSIGMQTEKDSHFTMKKISKDERSHLSANSADVSKTQTSNHDNSHKSNLVRFGQHSSTLRGLPSEQDSHSTKTSISKEERRYSNGNSADASKPEASSFGNRHTGNYVESSDYTNGSSSSSQTYKDLQSRNESYVSDGNASKIVLLGSHGESVISSELQSNNYKSSQEVKSFDSHEQNRKLSVEIKTEKKSHSTTVSTSGLERPHSSSIILITSSSEPKSNSNILLRKLSSKSCDEYLIVNTSKGNQQQTNDSSEEDTIVVLRNQENVGMDSTIKSSEQFSLKSPLENVETLSTNVEKISGFPTTNFEMKQQHYPVESPTTNAKEFYAVANPKKKDSENSENNRTPVTNLEIQSDVESADLNSYSCKQAPEVFITTEHMEKIQRKCNYQIATECNRYGYFVLDFKKLKQEMLNSTDELKMGLVQALRWRLTESDPDSRDQVVSSYIRHDLLGLHAAPNPGGQSFLESYYCPNRKTPHPLQEGMARLVNTFSSLTLGRDYLCQDDDVLVSLLIPLVMGTHYSKAEINEVTRDMIIATLQKLSIRNKQRVKMIAAGLVEHVVTFLSTNQNSISEYCMEYTTALLMNLCLHKEAQQRLHPYATDVVSLLADLLDTKRRYCMPYVNGTMYSLLSDPYINNEAKRLNLAKLIEYHIARTDGEMRKQLQFILKLHYESNSEMECCDSTIEPEYEVDLLESELDNGDSTNVSPNGEELLINYKLLFSVYGSQVFATKQCMCRPITPFPRQPNNSPRVENNDCTNKISPGTKTIILNVKEAISTTAEVSSTNTPNKRYITTPKPRSRRKSKHNKTENPKSDPLINNISETSPRSSKNSSRSNSPELYYSEDTKQFYHMPSATTGIFDSCKTRKLHRVPPSFTRTLAMPTRKVNSPSTCDNPQCPYTYSKATPIKPKENSSAKNPPYAIDQQNAYSTCYRDTHIHYDKNDMCRQTCEGCDKRNSRYMCNCYNAIKGYIDQMEQEHLNKQNINNNNNTKNNKKNSVNFGQCFTPNDLKMPGHIQFQDNEDSTHKCVNFTYEELLNNGNVVEDTCPKHGPECRCYESVFQSRPKILRTPP